MADVMAIVSKAQFEIVDRALLVRLRELAEKRRAAVAPERAEQSRELSARGDLMGAWHAVGVVSELPKDGPTIYGEPIDLASPSPSLSADGWTRLMEELAHLDPVLLVQSFPRDAGGFVLEESVLLAPCEARKPPPKNKQLWLVARSPARRKDGQKLALLLDTIPTSKFPVQWDTERWRWDTRASGATEEQRWGVAALPLPLLDAEERGERLAALARKLDDDSAAPGERAAASLLYLDDGNVREAFGCYDVGLGHALEEALAGPPARAFRELIVEGHGDMGDDYLSVASLREGERYETKWRERLRAELWRAAPWRLRSALDGSARSRRRNAARERLFALPYGPAARRPAVFLYEEDGEVFLEIDFVGIDHRLAEPFWTRPIELDLLRFGLG